MSSGHFAPQTSERRALSLGLSAVLLWSSVATGFKLGLAVLTPLQLVLLGSVISTLVFMLFLALRRVRSARPPAAAKLRWQHTLREAVPLAIINPLAYYPILLAGYDRLPAQIAQPLNYTWALVLAILAVPILKQPLSFRLICGLLISYGGAALLVAGGSRASWATSDPIGLLYILLSTVLWALYWLLNTRTQEDPLVLMLTSFALALPPLAGLTYWHDGWPALNLVTLSYGLWIGIIEMGVTFVLWQSALRATGQAARIGQLIFLAPFLSLIPIHWVLKEPILWTSVVGLAVIVAGLLVTGRPTSDPQPAR
ncbi:MAG: DMT family transporter [Pseudomonadales bacterium]